jgi:hypothetical protein
MKKFFFKLFLLASAVFLLAGPAYAGFVDITSSFEGTYSFSGGGSWGDFSYDVIFDIWEGDSADPGLYQYRYTITNYVDNGTHANRHFETLILEYDATIYEVGSFSGTGDVGPSGYASDPLIQWDFTGQGFAEGMTSDVLYFITDGYPEAWFTSYGNVVLGDASGPLPGAAAPEPATLIMLGMGFVGCLAGFRKRFKK